MASRNDLLLHSPHPTSRVPVYGLQRYSGRSTNFLEPELSVDSPLHPGGFPQVCRGASHSYLDQAWWRHSSCQLGFAPWARRLWPHCPLGLNPWPGSLNPPLSRQTSPKAPKHMAKQMGGDKHEGRANGGDKLCTKLLGNNVFQQK